MKLLFSKRSICPRVKLPHGILRDTLSYGIGSALSRALSLFVVPVLARSFSPEDYGFIDLLLTTSAAALLISGLNFEPPLTRYYLDYKENGRANTIIPTLLLTLLASTVLVMTVALAGWRPILRWLNIKSGLDAVHGMYFLALMSMPAKLFNQVLSVIARLERRAVAYAVATTLYSIVFLLLLAGVSFLHQLTIATYFVVVLIAELILFVVLWWVLRLQIILSLRAFSPQTAGLLGWFALQQAPSVVMAWVILNANRFFMSTLSSLHEIGLYAFASKLINGLAVLTIAFQMSWAPYYMSIYGASDARERYVVIMRRYLTLFSILVVLMACLAPELVYIVGTPEYAGAIPVMAIIGVALWLQQVWMFTHIGPLIIEKPWMLSLVQTGGFVVFLAATWMLVKPLGAVGAGLALGLSKLVTLILCVVLTQKVYPIPYPYKTTTAVLLLLVGVILLVNTAESLLWFRVGLAGIATILMVLLFNHRDLASYFRSLEDSQKLPIG